MVGVSPKYSTGDDGTTRRTWREDTRHVLATWSTNPFVGHRHRHETVEQRVVLEYTHGVGVDVLHEARSEDSGKFPDDWGVVQALEVRADGAYWRRSPKARWLE